MKVVSLTNELEPLWKKFVEDCPDSTMYHLVGWKHVFESVFGYKSFYLLALDTGDSVEGILPLFLMRDIFGRKYLVSNPFSNYAGICSKNHEAKEQLLQSAKRIAKQEDVQFIEFRQLNDKIENGLPTKDSFVTLMLRLPNDSNAFWDSLSSKSRNKIRLAEKKGLEPDFGLQYLSAFYSVLANNFKRLGTPVFPLKMFEAITKEFSNRIDLLVLKFEGKPISGMFFFKFKKILAEPWAASLQEYNKFKVNNLLYWQAINYGCENGFEYLDFGRSTVDTGTDYFKRQWGAEPVPLHYQYFLNLSREIPVVDAVDNKYQKIIDVWKKLPLAVTNFIGPKVVRYLPEL